MVDDFFRENRERSAIKREIVTKYFDAWASVMIGNIKSYPMRHSGKLCYLDLFAGPGKYDDGTESTPVVILKKAVKNPELRARLVTVFNDKDPKFTASLRRVIQEIPGIESLKYEPLVLDKEVDKGITHLFEAKRIIPTLSFLDPWGYKGLSLTLVRALIKDWGCDCIFFFNYRRINAALQNEVFAEHMKEIFGEAKISSLGTMLQELEPDERELTVISEL